MLCSYGVLFIFWTVFLFGFWLQEALIFVKKIVRESKNNWNCFFLLRDWGFDDRIRKLELVMRVKIVFLGCFAIFGLHIHIFQGEKIITFHRKNNSHLSWSHCFDGAIHRDLNSFLTEWNFRQKSTRLVSKLGKSDIFAGVRYVCPTAMKTATT